MFASPVEEIKSRLDIVEFIQSYLKVQKAGINFKAQCPFHSEKTPSFFISPNRQIWHCFGCGKGGDIFKFVMEIEGHDFPEALRLLAQRAGIELKREDPAIRSERNRLYDLCEEAAKVFERSLSLTPAVRTYLNKRGLTEDTVKKFRVGFAPQSWDFLLKSLQQKGFTKEDTEKAGLAIKSEDKSSWYDRFRSRVMFPIFDGNGRVIGFGGRIFESEEFKTKNKESGKVEAKYVNTPNTLIYDKSRVLYGFDKAKDAIRQKNQVVIVEGYMDCAMSHQAGVEHTISVSGTALTPHQLKNLRRLCDTMVCSFDTDEAGDSATRRSLSLAVEFEFERKIVAIPSGKDPADTVAENPKLWHDAVAGATSAVAFYFAKAFRDKSSVTVESKKAIAAALMPFIAELTNEIEKAHWVSELARRLTTPEEAIWKEVNRTGKGHSPLSSRKDEIPMAGAIPRKSLLEERVLMLFSSMNEADRTTLLKNHELVFSSALHNNLFGILRSTSPDVSSPELTPILASFQFKGEVLAQGLTDVSEEFRICVRELEKECIRERLVTIEAEIGKKEPEGNHAVVSALLQDFRLLSEKLKNLS